MRDQLPLIVSCYIITGLSVDNASSLTPFDLYPNFDRICVAFDTIFEPDRQSFTILS
jgi:hypothetical protein